MRYRNRLLLLLKCHRFLQSESTLVTLGVPPKMAAWFSTTRHFTPQCRGRHEKLEVTARLCRSAAHLCIRRPAHRSRSSSNRSRALFVGGRVRSPSQPCSATARNGPGRLVWRLRGPARPRRSEASRASGRPTGAPGHCAGTGRPRPSVSVSGLLQRRRL